MYVPGTLHVHYVYMGELLNVLLELSPPPNPTPHPPTPDHHLHSIDLHAVL